MFYGKHPCRTDWQVVNWRLQAKSLIHSDCGRTFGHSNIKMTERYAKLGREHIPKTSTTAKVSWSLMKKKPEQKEGGQQDVA